MTDWNSAHYLKFKNERTQPAIDLAARLDLKNPGKIADIGCGPGNSTRVLKSFFPQASVIGFDNSKDMLDNARRQNPDLEFQFCDAAAELPKLDRDFDLVFSNACLHWLPDHAKRIPELLAMLKTGGTLAVQMPANSREPVRTIITDLVRSPNWSSLLQDANTSHVLEPEGYYDLLARCSSSFDIWQVTYFHIMASHQAIFEWFRSTALRPYLDRIPEDRKGEFESTFVDAVRRAYPVQSDGKIIFRFPRLFFTAIR